MMATRKSFPVLLTLAALVLLALLLALGTWQVQRLQWKVGLMDAADAAATLPPVPLSQVIDDEGAEFRQVVVVCRGLNTAPFVQLRTIDQGEPGMRLVSTCALDDGRTIMVDRGFVHQDNAERPAVDAASELPVAVMGVLREPTKPSAMTPPAEGLMFYARDNQAMARALGADGALSHWTLYALTPTNPEMAALRPSAPPAAFTNNHLGYALTWFGLAAALIILYTVLLRRRLKRPDDHQGQSL